MMSASSYFHALLGPNFAEGRTKQVVITDVVGATLKSIIDFCYTGAIVISDENINSIIAAASKMNMVDIEKLCVQHWMENLCVDNVVETFMSADKYSLVELRRRSFNMMYTYFDDVTGSQLQALEYPQMVELLKCDDIYGPEEDICRKLIEWVDFDKQNRSNFAPELLKLIRLEHIPVQVKHT